jgi:hypothetical protein
LEEEASRSKKYKKKRKKRKYGTLTKNALL